MTSFPLFARLASGVLVLAALAACTPESTGSTQTAARQGATASSAAPAGGLYGAPLVGPTPAKAAGVTVDAGKAREMVEMGDAAAFDVRAGATAPGAVSVAWLGAPKGSAAEEAALRRRLMTEFDGLKSTPIVVVGAGPEDRAAWNAAQRVRQAGFAKVIWRRAGGL